MSSLVLIHETYINPDDVIVIRTETDNNNHFFIILSMHGNVTLSIPVIGPKSNALATMKQIAKCLKSGTAYEPVT